MDWHTHIDINDLASKAPLAEGAWDNTCVFMSEDSIEDYPDSGCFRYMCYRSDLDFGMTKFMDALEKGDSQVVYVDLVFRMDSKQKEATNGDVYEAATYVVVPVCFYKRNDNRWMVTRYPSYLKGVVSADDGSEAYVHYADITGKHLSMFLEKALGHLRWFFGMSEIMYKSKKQMQRIFDSSYSILDELIPTDVVVTILDKVYALDT